MALSDTISTIISRTKSIEICDTLHDAQIATTEDELIAAGMPLVAYSYRNRIIDDTLLADFTEAKLNAASIYTTGTFTISDPADDVYILKNANVSINMTGNNKCRINILGAASLTLVAGDNSYAFVVAENAANLSVTVNAKAIVKIEGIENVIANIALNTNATLQTKQKGSSEFTITGNNSSYAKAILFEHATLTYYLNDTAIVDTDGYDASVINAPPLV